MCDYWAKLPTLYFSQAKDTDMKMRIYDKGTGNTELGSLGLRCKTLCDVLYDTLGEFGAIQA